MMHVLGIWATSCLPCQLSNQWKWPLTLSRECIKFYWRYQSHYAVQKWTLLIFASSFFTAIDHVLFTSKLPGRYSPFPTLGAQALTAAAAGYKSSSTFPPSMLLNFGTFLYYRKLLARYRLNCFFRWPYYWYCAPGLAPGLAPGTRYIVRTAVQKLGIQWNTIGSSSHHLFFGIFWRSGRYACQHAGLGLQGV